MRRCLLGVAAGMVLAACSSVTPATTGDLESSYIAVVQTVGPSVVEIQTAGSLGSGVVFDGRGDIVTNAHVIGQEERFTVITSAGKEYPASLVGSYPADDLAVIRVSGGSLKPARFADSAKVRVGQVVLAIGSPLGLQSSVTQGIVSATNRVVRAGQGVTLPDAIQTSAAINPGNSGGALVDLADEVLGIPTLAALQPTTETQAPGIGFAISSNRASDIAGQLIRNGRVMNSHRAYLGVQFVPTTAGGVFVAAVESGGPADMAGIHPGDLIVAVGGRSSATPGDLSTALAARSPGESVEVDLVRADGRKQAVTVKLGELPG